MANHFLVGLSSNVAAELLSSAEDDEQFYIVTSSNQSSPQSGYKSLISKVFSLDLSSASYLEIANIVETLPEINRLTYLAGLAIGKSFADTTDVLLDAVYNVNVLSFFRIVRALHQHNKLAVNSSIVAVSSVSASKGGFDDAYNSSKAALSGLVRSLSAKLSPRTRINILAPGIIADSNMTARRKNNDLDVVIKAVPMNRFVTSEEVSAYIRFMHSSSSLSLVGASIDLNGGNYLRP
jgi:3-oxoacyl-[acyl-carrier protein] reductase